jgi:hypothetical protein
VVSLIIRQGHIGDPDSEFLVIWAGRIVAAHREGGEAVLLGRAGVDLAAPAGLRRNYQYGCPHALYSVGPGLCNADKASKTLSATVDSVDGATVTMDAGWNGAFAAAKFLGGLFEWVNDDGLTDRRTILRVTGNILSLSGIAKDVDPGDTVSVVVGCNHKAYAEQERRLPAAARQHPELRRRSVDPAQESHRRLQQLLLRLEQWSLGSSSSQSRSRSPRCRSCSCRSRRRTSPITRPTSKIPPPKPGGRSRSSSALSRSRASNCLWFGDKEAYDRKVKA